MAASGLINVADAGFRWWHLREFRRHMRGHWYCRKSTSGDGQTYEAGLASCVERQDLDEAMAQLDRAIKSPQRSNPIIIRQFTQRLFDSATLRANKERWCEKTPANILYASRLWKIFPEMKFVHIIRDGRDVVSSMMQRGFWPIARQCQIEATSKFHGPIRFETAVDYWKTILELARQESQEIPKDNYLELRLEDLTDNTEETVDRLTKFLGVQVEQPLFRQNLTRSNAERWKTDLTPDQIAYFHRVAGEDLEREGYKVA